MRIALKILLVLGITSLSFASRTRRTEDPDVIPWEEDSYSVLSEEWWKFHYRIPADIHPASVDGECDTGQVGKVWFLEGTYTNEVNPDPDGDVVQTVVRDCNVPRGKSLFFPIFNVDCNTVATDGGFLLALGENEETCATKFFESPFSVRDLSFSLDGDELDDIDPDYYTTTDVFDLTLPDDNIAGVDCEAVDCDDIQAVSAGYFVHVRPLLSIGSHTIQFTGGIYGPKNSNPRSKKVLYFGLDVTYNLNVI